MKPVLFMLTLFASLCCEAQSNVYSLSIYACGTSYTELCSLRFPFSPNHYKLTAISWREDARGGTIMDPNHTNAPSDVRRCLLEVEYGTTVFKIPVTPLSSSHVEGTNVISAEKGSGDFVQRLFRCMTNHGSYPTTNNLLPVLQATWLQFSQTNLEVIVVEGNYFMKVKELLDQSYDAPDDEIRSSAPVGNAQSLTYTPRHTSVVINLTGNGAQTILSVIGKPRH